MSELGEQLGIIPTEQALERARDAGDVRAVDVVVRRADGGDAQSRRHHPERVEAKEKDVIAYYYESTIYFISSRRSFTKRV